MEGKCDDIVNVPVFYNRPLHMKKKEKKDFCSVPFVK